MNQKRTYLFTVAIAVLMSTLTVGGYHLLTQTKSMEKPLVSKADNSDVRMLYTKDSNGEMIPLDFTETTEKVLDAVVHIKSTRTGTNLEGNRQYRELPDPFKEFFKGSPFGGLYGSPRQGEGRGERFQPSPVIGTGSGVIINEEGYVVTNNHVIADADEIEVTLHDNTSYKATVVGTDPSTDLALLQIKGKNLKALSLVNSDDVEVGEWVLAIGNPFSLNSTVTAGIVSAKARNININKEKFAVESFIQTDAAINPGNSGGALVNLNGDLIGINTAIASRTGTYNGYGFAVPSNIVTKVIEDLLKYGNVQRGVLGVTIRTMDGNLAKEKDIDFEAGVYIEQVNEDSAADKGGVKAGDIVLEVEGKRVTTSPRLQELIAGQRPGDQIQILVNRNGKEKKLEVVLENAQGNANTTRKEHVEVLRYLGVDLEAIDEEEATSLEIRGGVKITKLYPGKLRKDTAVQEGFVITHVDGKTVNSVEDVVKSIEGKKGGVMLEGVYPDQPGKHYYAFGTNL